MSEVFRTLVSAISIAYSALLRGCKVVDCVSISHLLFMFSNYGQCAMFVYVRRLVSILHVSDDYSENILFGSDTDSIFSDYVYV